MRTGRALISWLLSIFWLVSLPGMPMARAVTCGAENNQQISEAWFPSGSGPAGFRSPIYLRKDGALCDGGSDTGAWVGIQSGTSKLVQIGWVHISGVGFCRFYEQIGGSGDTGGAVTSRCGSDPNGTARYYDVEESLDASCQCYRYAPIDCGTTDWSSCSMLDDGAKVSDYTSPFALADSEADHACEDRMMGSASGTTLFHVMKGLTTPGGSWDVRGLTPSGLNCSDYQRPTATDQTLEIYDDRN